jgi:PEP-CTERM motif-containing protein
MKRQLFAIIACMLLPVSQASATTYQLNNLLSFVSGTITTDGTLGTLTSPSQITAWTINQTFDTLRYPASISSPASPSNSTVTLTGNALTATATGLFFNFSGSGGSLLEFASNNFFGGSGGISLQYCDATGNCLNQNLTVLHSFALMAFIDPGTSSTSSGVMESGTMIEIATAVPSSVPLPATLPFFATGLGVLGLLGWRRKRKNSAPA